MQSGACELVNETCRLSADALKLSKRNETHEFVDNLRWLTSACKNVVCACGSDKRTFRCVCVCVGGE